MLKSSVRVSIRILFLLVTSHSVCAKPTTLPICPGIIRFGYIQESSLGYGKGIDNDFLKALEQRSHCQFDAIEMPSVRIEHELKTGKIHMSSPWLETPERDGYAWFATYAVNKNVLLYRSNLGKMIGIKEIMSDDHLVIGQVRGTRYGKNIDQFIGKIIAVNSQRVTYFNDTTALIEGFKSGRVSAILVTAEIAIYIRSRWANFACNVMDLSPFASKQSGGLMMSKKLITQNEAERWKAIVQSMCTDGTLHKIMGRYSRPSELSPVVCNLPTRRRIVWHRPNH